MDPMDLPLPTHLLSNSTKQDICHMGKVCCGAGTSHNFIYSKLSCYLPNTKIAYLFNSDDNETGEAGKGTDIDDLLNFFEYTDDIAYQVLWDVPSHTLLFQPPTLIVPISNPTPESSTSPLSPSKLVMRTKHTRTNITKEDVTNDPDMNPIREWSSESRTVQKLHPGDKLFVAVAWVLQKELWYFKLFPEVVHVDATSHTSRKKYNLLTFSCCTSTAKQVIFLKIWIPNQ